MKRSAVPSFSRKTRLAMRERPRADLQRNEIARYAGVTPALISYYFPDRSNLFEAAAHPVIESYVADVRSIIGSNRHLIDRLNDLIFLFVKFNYQEGHLLDFYLEHIERTSAKKNMQLLEEIYREMLTFFEELLRTKTIRGGQRSRYTIDALGYVQTYGKKVRHRGRGRRNGCR